MQSFSIEGAEEMVRTASTCHSPTLDLVIIFSLHTKNLLVIIMCIVFSMFL